MINRTCIGNRPRTDSVSISLIAALV